MANKMLIDAAHPEETRVVVVRGDRVEEFDFESANHKQLRGNIYLAKVTRVEPSLQAAFVDYGGNRHGFLAFSEIHPDYYQIPVADRQALLEQEAAEQEEERRLDEDEQDSSGSRRRGRRRRSSSRSRSAKETAAEAQESESAEGETSIDAETAAENDADLGNEPASGGKGDVEEDTAAETQSDDQSSADKNAQTDLSETAPAEPELVAEPSDAKAAVQADDAQDQPLETSEPGQAGDAETSAAVEPSSNADVSSTTENSDRSETSDGPLEAEAGPQGETATASSAPIDGEPAESENDTQDGSPDKPPRNIAAAIKDEAIEAKAPGDAEEETPEVTQDVSETAETEGNADGAFDDHGDRVHSDDDDNANPDDDNEPSDDQEEDVEDSDDQDPDDEATSSSDDEEDEESVEDVGAEDALEEVPERPRRPRRVYKIQEVIKRRQILLVQVVKEERGNKGAALTTYLSLAGRYSVLMPNTARGGGISRKITNATDRKRLKTVASELSVPEGMGVILRTAGASRTKAEIKRDFEYLMRLWENVRELTLESVAPTLVYEEGSLVKRSIRDLYNKDIDQVSVAGDEAYREAKTFMRMLMPSHAKNVQPYRDDIPLFSRFGVETQLDAMFSPQVTLRSGGYIVINQTEALVAIDVNSGKSTREHNIEDTALQTNLEAATEVARQLRLRDLAGLIVIDFIDMEENRNNRAVERKMKDVLKSDRARIQVGRISHFGLLEMSRQRLRTGVLEGSTEICPHCHGAGRVRSVESVALHVLRAIEDYLMKNSNHNLTVKTRTEVALYVLNSKRHKLGVLEARFGLEITIVADESLHPSLYALERGEPATATPARPVAIDVTTVHPDSDIEDEAADRAAVEAEAEAEERDDSEDVSNDSKGRRKRRRRRRSRGSEGGGRDEQDRVTAADEEQDETALDSADAGDPDAQDDAEGDEDRPKKRRRRGRRGGRRNRKGREDEQTVTAEAESDEDAASVADDQSDDTTAVSEFDDTETVKTSAVMDDETLGQSDEVQPDEATSDAVTAEDVDSAAHKASEGQDGAGEPVEEADTNPAATVAEPQDDQTSAEVVAAEEVVEEAAVAEPIHQPEPEAEPAPEEPPKPKRRGWWQRRMFS